jgi:hypothetical protein
MSKEFARWELDTRIALADRGISYHLADPLIGDARRHCTENGQSPYEAFGSPQDFAAASAAELPDSARATVDRRGKTASGYLSDGVFVAGFMLAALSLFGGVVFGTWTLVVTPARLVGATLLALTFATAFGLPPTLRAAGHPRLANAGYVLAAVLIVATATSSLLPKTRLFSVPVLAVTAVGAVLCWLTIRRGKAPAERPKAPAPVNADDPDQWFNQMNGLLVGRHDLPSSRAGELVAEARVHTTQTGTSPVVEFGPVAVYAANLAEHEPVREEAWWRRHSTQILLAALAVAGSIYFFFAWLHDGYVWVAYLVCMPGALGFSWTLVRTIRNYTQHRSGQHGTPPPSTA